MTLTNYTDVRGDYASGTQSSHTQITPQDIATCLSVPAPSYRPNDAHYQIYMNHSSSNGRLLVFAPGQPDLPEHYTAFAKRAAKNGYHVIVLHYWNADPDATSANCDTKYPTNPTADNTCMDGLYEGWYRDYKQLDPVFTTPPSSGAKLNREDQLQNRLRQALKYLDKNFPNQDWGQFAAAGGFDTSPYLDWSKVTFAGHSSGSKLMAHAAKDWKVHAVIMLSGPNAFYDKTSTTTACPTSVAPNSTTPIQNMYVYYNTNDPKHTYAEACHQALGLTGLPTASIKEDFSGKGAHIIYNSALAQSSCDSNQASPESSHLSTAEDCAIVATPAGVLQPSETKTFAIWDYLLTR
jgi:hypothetical protein